MSIAMLKKMLLTPNKSRRSSFGMKLAMWNQISGGMLLAITCQGEQEIEQQRNIEFQTVLVEPARMPLAVEKAENVEFC